MKDQTLKGALSAEEILALKQKHGNVFAYTVDGKICYLKMVDRNSYSQAVSKISTSPAKFNEVIIENSWLGGDEEIKKNDQYYFGLIDFVEELLAKKKGTLTSL